MSRRIPLKRVAQIRYGLGQPPPLSDDGIPILRATNIARGKITENSLLRAKVEDLPLERAPLLQEGEILVVRSGAYTGDSARITREWAGSAPGYDLRVTPQTIDSRYLAYALLGTSVQDQINLASSRAAQPHLNAEELGEMQLWVPPLGDQQRIANFLDAETARIDHVLERRARQILLLDGACVSRAYDAVRGGSVQGVRKESGLSWLGTVPDSWRVAAVSHLFEVELGKMLNQERARGSHLRPYLRCANVQWDEIETADLLEMDFPPDEQPRYRLRKGDLMVCEGGSWPGRAAIWGGEIAEIYYQKALHRIRPRGGDLTRWLYYCLLVAEKMRVFAVQGNSSTITHLTLEQLRPQRFPFPEIDTQRRIVMELDQAAEKDRALRQKLLKQQELLAERRQALITAAVTGQFDVTTCSCPPAA
ncbi:restriction endonuclease subunit S [Streptomyces roseicoloratus]|uniref:Restriction endonuclease subunit S n=1 Tax=Streptomyces roseicoloratus TaxID=2508722 RepID=A0ABY9RYR5_9ACTN|nr:restriction endonuclease subunit S [Streptomyces roseicoloratus]WMX46319.1 restriction endonuclease subunit S [Streptomyces roseicoloratus]